MDQGDDKFKQGPAMVWYRYPGGGEQEDTGNLDTETRKGWGLEMVMPEGHWSQSGC